MHHHIENIADVCDKPINCAAPLSDDALSEGGLVKVSAFIRTRSSANALRVKKARQRAADDGLRQLNVVAPVQSYMAIKELAKALQSGSVADAAKELLVGELLTSGPTVSVHYGRSPIRRARTDSDPACPAQGLAPLGSAVGGAGAMTW